MLRWLIAALFVANLVVFAAVRGVFGPTPAAGAREPSHLSQQIQPDRLQVRPLNPAQTAPPPVVGAPVADPAIAASTLTQ
jgi:hypothetical protein